MSKKTSTVSRRAPLTKRGEETVAKVLDATRKLLMEKGYGKLTTNHVAQQAGVSIGTLYQYFPNKESLLYALVERWYQALNEDFDRNAESMADEANIFVVFRQIYTDILEQQYQHYQAYADIDKVAAHIPELLELKNNHTHQFSQRLLKLFSRYGYASKGKSFKQLSVFFYQISVVMLNLTALETGKARQLNLQLSLRITDELVRAAIDISQES